MPRIARVVVPDTPHHITQRGNRKQLTFFHQEDYQLYLDLLAEWCRRCDVEIWAYCLMPNHVHLIAVPRSEDLLAKAIGETHRRYTRHINFREGWRGCLWQGRFASYPMDERYLLAAARYIERNPVEAKMVARPEDYPWSSTKAHMTGRDNGIVMVAPLLGLITNWKEFLADPTAQEEENILLSAERTGRPLGDNSFLSKLETILGRALRKRKPGRRSKAMSLVN